LDGIFERLTALGDCLLPSLTAPPVSKKPTHSTGPSPRPPRYRAAPISRTSNSQKIRIKTYFLSICLRTLA